MIKIDIQMPKCCIGDAEVCPMSYWDDNVPSAYCVLLDEEIFAQEYKRRKEHCPLIEVGDSDA